MIKKRYGKALLWSVCIASLLGGGAILFHELSGPASPGAAHDGDERLNVTSSPIPPADIPGAFTADSANLYSFRYDDKDAFSLAVAQFRNASGARSSAVLFPKEAQDGVISSSQTGLRNEIWQTASEAISKHAPQDALFLSWWDDGQRIHYLSGREAWLQKPGEATFASSVWKAMRSDLIEASSHERLEHMARWLTMDVDKALAEIVAYFGKSRPIYLLVNNDLLLRLAEIKAYGGSDLGLQTKNVPAGDNLHGDIAQVKRWAHESGQGNYLAHKEGRYYRTWVTTRESQGKNTLLVRLLPFIDSLKKLPEGLSLVYQSGWGGYLSVYKIEASEVGAQVNRASASPSEPELSQ